MQSCPFSCLYSPERLGTSDPLRWSGRNASTAGEPGIRPSVAVGRRGVRATILNQDIKQKFRVLPGRPFRRGLNTVSERACTHAKQNGGDAHRGAPSPESNVFGRAEPQSLHDTGKFWVVKQKSRNRRLRGAQAKQLLASLLLLLQLLRLL